MQPHTLLCSPDDTERIPSRTYVPSKFGDAVSCPLLVRCLLQRLLLATLLSLVRTPLCEPKGDPFALTQAIKHLAGCKLAGHCKELSIQKHPGKACKHTTALSDTMEACTAEQLSCGLP